jgi:hypothetical protein
MNVIEAPLQHSADQQEPYMDNLTDVLTDGATAQQQWQQEQKQPCTMHPITQHQEQQQQQQQEQEQPEIMPDQQVVQELLLCQQLLQHLASHNQQLQEYLAAALEDKSQLQVSHNACCKVQHQQLQLNSTQLGRPVTGSIVLCLLMAAVV